MNASMKTLVAAVSLAVLSCSAFAADDKGEAKKPTAQQERMKACNQDATGKKGDERKAFMSNCLKGKSEAAAPAAAAPAGCEGMAAEKKLAGAAKSSFMKKCSADAGAAPAAAPAADACAKQAEEKKLAGAAKSSFMKKCEADAKK
jgi:hypothetical protein